MRAIGLLLFVFFGDWVGYLVFAELIPKDGAGFWALAIWFTAVGLTGAALFCKEH